MVAYLTLSWFDSPDLEENTAVIYESTFRNIYLYIRYCMIMYILDVNEEASHEHDTSSGTLVILRTQ